MSDSILGQAALDRAQEEKNLLLVYQPIHEAGTRRIRAAEALLRQRRQSGEIREASLITTAAEQGRDLFALDSWSARSAFSDAARWPATGGAEVRVNLNLSPREFQEGNVLSRLTHLVLGCGVETGRINLEIIETAYIHRPEETREVLTDLKRLGLQLWLDDFGTGHSSIEHLQHFPVDGLKISGQFVKSIDRDARSRVITQALIRLAHDLGLEVVAEGVERKEQLDLLLTWGCDYIQGFLYSRPMTREAFEALLKEQSATRSAGTEGLPPAGSAQPRLEDG